MIFTALQWLKLGSLGVGGIALAYAAYLLDRERRRDQPRQSILRSIRELLLAGVVMFVVGGVFEYGSRVLLLYKPLPECIRNEIEAIASVEADLEKDADSNDPEDWQRSLRGTSRGPLPLIRERLLHCRQSGK